MEKQRVKYLCKYLFESRKHYESRVNEALIAITNIDKNKNIRLITYTKSVYIYYTEERKVNQIGFTSK